MIVKALAGIACFSVLMLATWLYALYENSIHAPYDLDDIGKFLIFLSCAAVSGLLILVAGSKA